MGGVMADQLQRARVIAIEELDLCIVRDRIGEIGQRPVERHRDRALGERRRDRLGDVETGDACGVFTARTVRKGEGDRTIGGHFQLLLLTRCLRLGRRANACQIAVFRGVPCSLGSSCVPRSIAEPLTGHLRERLSGT